MAHSLDRRTRRGARRMVNRTGREITYVASGIANEDFLQGRVVATAPTSYALRAAVRQFHANEIQASGGAIVSKDYRVAIDDSRLAAAIGRAPNERDAIVIDGLQHSIIAPIRSSVNGQLWILQVRA